MVFLLMCIVFLYINGVLLGILKDEIEDLCNNCNSGFVLQ